MSCPGIPNFDTITVNNLESEYNKLTNNGDKVKFKTCLQEKYSDFSPKCEILPELLNDYDERLERNITATEKNEQSRQQYIFDVFYLLFKSIIFIILGIFLLKPRRLQLTRPKNWRIQSNQLLKKFHKNVTVN